MKNLNYVQDPFAEVEEDIEVFFSHSQERKEKINKKFLGKLSKASLLVLVLKLKTRETFLFTCGSNLYSPQEIGWIYALIPSLQAIISQVWCRLPLEIEGLESMESFKIKNLQSGKGKNYSPLELISEKNKPLGRIIDIQDFLSKEKNFPLTHYNPEGQSFSYTFVAVAMEIIEIRERLKDPSISAEEREYLKGILMRLLLLFPFLFPFWFARKLIDFQSPYPYVGAAVLLSYLFYKNKEKLLPLFSNSFGKQVALITNKEVAKVLTDSQKQVLTVLTSFEKQLAIVLHILEKQVELVPDKNKQLILVLNILSKELELIADKKKQVAIVLGILAKQLVLRATDLPLPLVVEPHLATGTDLVVYNDKQLNLFNNETPLRGEDHF